MEHAFNFAKKCYDMALKFYGDENRDVIAENLVTMARYHKDTDNLDAAEKCIKKAISAFAVLAPTL